MQSTHSRKRFEHAETNDDGRLSLDEAKAQRKWERAHRADIKPFERLRDEFGEERLSNARWLVQHPELFEKLLRH